MKSIIILQVVIVLCSSCINKQKHELTGKDIWEKYLETCGSRENILNVKTYSTTIIYDSKYGEVKSVIKVMYPDKVFEEISFPNGVVTYVINGNTGIVRTPNGVKELTESEMKLKEWALIFPEMHYKESGYGIELLGEEKIEGTIYYRIKVDKETETIEYLINKSNFNLFQIISNGYIEEVVETIEIDNIKLRKTIKSINKSDTNFMEYTNQKLNPELHKDIFELK